MIITTNKSETWLTAGFANIIDVKKIIGSIFDNYKSYWEKDVPGWDYIIEESEVAIPNNWRIPFSEHETEYAVTIRCGLAGDDNKAMIIRESIILSKPDFADKSYAMLSIWNKLLITIGTAGAVKIYEDTITMYRKGMIESNGVLWGQNPLTPLEYTIQK